MTTDTSQVLGEENNLPDFSDGVKAKDGDGGMPIPDKVCNIRHIANDDRVSEVNKISKPVGSPAGCLTCRQRHKKCSRTKPVCETCLRSSYECFWREPGTRFTDYNVSLIRTKCPKGVTIKPNKTKKTSSTTGDQILDCGTAILDALETDSSLLSVAQKAVSITNAYMNSAEIQSLLEKQNGDIDQVKEIINNGPQEENGDQNNSEEERSDGEDEEDEENQDNADTKTDSYTKDDDPDDQNPGSSTTPGESKNTLPANAGAANGTSATRDKTGQEARNDEANDTQSQSQCDDESNDEFFDASDILDSPSLSKFKSMLDRIDHPKSSQEPSVKHDKNPASAASTSFPCFTKFLDTSPLDNGQIEPAASKASPFTDAIDNSGMISSSIIVGKLFDELNNSHTSLFVPEDSESSSEAASHNLAEKENARSTNNRKPMVSNSKHARKSPRSSKRRNHKTTRNSLMFNREQAARLLIETCANAKLLDVNHILDDGRKHRYGEKKHIEVSELPHMITKFLKAPSPV